MVKLSIFSKFIAKIEVSQSTYKLRDFLPWHHHCDVIYLVSKDMLTNKEQLYQSFWQSVKEHKFKAKKVEGGQFESPPPPPPQGF